MRLFSYLGLTIKLRNLEIGLHLAQEFYSSLHTHDLFSFNYRFWNISIVKKPSFCISIEYSDVIRTATMAFYTYIYALNQTQG